MRVYILIIAVLLTSYACNEKAQNNTQNEEITVESLKTSIKEMDDSLHAMMEKAKASDDYKMNRVAYHEAINRNKKFYETFPKDPYSETALNKIAALYFQLNIESESVKWRDTLLHNYPETPNKIGVLELQMNYYDYNEYDPEKIKFYANQLLAIENLPESKREQYEFRLEHIDKTFEELIEFQMENNENETDVKPK
ncbi:hypothetical protein CW751_14260 [Brumimicrobium salinarum]|uniref:Outer membrane lipoprotein BamD-like domain-containing protein n=1 Tax=Brumimicrobium salinarum TaxID=2058658 RepID=A0A2I0QZ50_9FLAO|nr:hypothetical protein [Brumimicrobium salinarum]PKR79579.1 hypothetical protein CW751_14260 [Brumimicrobium salinarum]